MAEGIHTSRTAAVIALTRPDMTVDQHHSTVLVLSAASLCLGMSQRLVNVCNVVV